MPKVTVFPHTVTQDDDRDSIKLHDHAGEHSVYETTDLLFFSGDARECSKSLEVLAQLRAAVIAVIDTVEAKRTAFLIEELTPADEVFYVVDTAHSGGPARFTDRAEAEEYARRFGGEFIDEAQVDPDVQHKVRGGE